VLILELGEGLGAGWLTVLGGVEVDDEEPGGSAGDADAVGAVSPGWFDAARVEGGPAFPADMAIDAARLRDAMMRCEFDTEALARKIDVDPKTVERWISTNRVPHARTRAKASAVLGETQSYLWPDAFDEQQRSEISESELVKLYHRRTQVEDETWARLVDQAEQHLDVLALAGLFFPEQQRDLAKTLCGKAKTGTKVRILLGDPEGEVVARRGAEEGIGDAMAAKVHNVLSFYRSHAEHDCFEIRFHDATLYNSIYRFDDDMLVNSHIYGVAAAHAPVHWYRRLAGGAMFDAYAESFDGIWSEAVGAWDRLEGAG